MAAGDLSSRTFRQGAIAIVGLACRLPGHCSTPADFLKVLQEARVASIDVPKSRFNGSAFYTGPDKPGSIRSPGGMFIENIDPKLFDARFFGVPQVAAQAMDPQQRQLLEVVYEAMENAGLRLEDVSNKLYGCFVGSYAVDYADIQSRDPSDRVPSVTVGVGRAILSNRISYFLNIKGPSMTIDTACSGSLVGLDVACRYLTNGEIEGAVVAGANLYLSPEHAMDTGVINGAMSPTGRCHTFDARADGYIKAEAVNAVILKRLDDALRDGDPIRAVIRGSSTNNDGRTAGITAPSLDAQAAAIRAAYANAGIADLDATTYVECHGTGTQAGDPAELSGVASAFRTSGSHTRRAPLLVGSAKANIGHSEPAAGITGLIKAVLTLENDFIPGLPSFETPNPRIDFEALNLSAFAHAVPWPPVALRRVSVNSFGYGGSNVHVVLDAPSSQQRTSHVFSRQSRVTGLLDNESKHDRPVLLVLSANDEPALHRSFQALKKHLLDPRVVLDYQSLAYTLSERRSRLFHRGIVATSSTNLDHGRFITGKRQSKPPSIAFIFTGQGAQWAQQGKALLELFPRARNLIVELDGVLKALPHPPTWSLLEDLTLPRTDQDMQRPQLSQTLVTALQLALIEILRGWNITPRAVLGHSSGEIAAAAAAGLVTNAEAIALAYYRGFAVEHGLQTGEYGMLAVGVGAVDAQTYMRGVQDAVEVACRNSWKSTTLAGRVAELAIVKGRLEAAGLFARSLRVTVAYHSHFIKSITDHYKELITPLVGSVPNVSKVDFFSSVTGRKQDLPIDVHYWPCNMASVVRFEEAFTSLVHDSDVAVDLLLEIGPSGALAGPVKQLIDSLDVGSRVSYAPAFARGKEAISTLFESVGRAFNVGVDVDLCAVNDINRSKPPPFIVDLPNYPWDRSESYWYESESSKDWRHRSHPHHELLGSKVMGTSWHDPSWKIILKLDNLPWLKDHKIGDDILFPATGYIAMAAEAVLQQHEALASSADEPPRVWGVRLRDVRFQRALPLDAQRLTKMMLTLRPRTGAKESWREYRISSLLADSWQEHSTGLVRLAHKEEAIHRASATDAEPLDRPVPGSLWYKAMRDVGYNFGPSFQVQEAISSLPGHRRSRSYATLQPGLVKTAASRYLIHPAPLDGCLQSTAPAMWEGVRWNVDELLVPVHINDIFISSLIGPDIGKARIEVTSEYSGTGRPDLAKSHLYNLSVFDSNNANNKLVQVSGLTHSAMERPSSVYDQHRYSQVVWNPDVSFLKSSTSLAGFSLVPDVPATRDLELGEKQPPATIRPAATWPSRTHDYLALILHKYAKISVLEIIHDHNPSQSLWLGLPESHREAAKYFLLAVSRFEDVVSAKSQYPTAALDGGIVVLEPSKQVYEEFARTHPGISKFDLVIYRSSHQKSAKAIDYVRPYISMGGHVLLCQGQDQELLAAYGHTGAEEDAQNHTEISNGTHDHPALNAIDNIVSDLCHDTHQGLQSSTLNGRQSSGFQEVNLWADSSSRNWQTNPAGVVIVSKLTRRSKPTSRLLQHLASAGWAVKHDISELARTDTSATQLVVEDGEPILPTISHEEWGDLKTILKNDARVLWITEGSQMAVAQPLKALVHGLRRTVCAENPSLHFTTLDVQEIGGPRSSDAVLAVLHHLQATGVQQDENHGAPAANPQDREFVERGGILHVSRVVPDLVLNNVALERGKGGSGGPKLERALTSVDSRVALRCERPGDLASLVWQEEDNVAQLEPGTVEVEVMAVSLAFKDVAVAMGLVPENEHMLGLDGAGYVRRVASSGVATLEPGQRVVVSGHGVLANRVIKPACRVRQLPDWMEFEQVATTPFITALYSLDGLARLQKGNRVLIHSASGSLGAAVIQLCRYADAEVFATVGSDEKKQFLVNKYGLREDHVFSSRTTAFADGIRNLTSGRGVDIVLNSLTGELLEESWRCIAEGGTFIELGKRDLLDHGYLPMQPFLRNASYRCVDFGHREMPDELIGATLEKAMTLLSDRVLEPIEPVTLFGFDKVEAALRVMSSYHIGRVVVSRSSSPDVQLRIRSRPRVLRLDPTAAYLLVGGLKGLNGGIAVQLALWGARTLVILGRSGYDDNKSQAVLRELELLDVNVVLVCGDVSVEADVHRFLTATDLPIRGIIQAAMVLRDRVFASMSHAEYHQALCSKVQGTWYLHSATQEFGLHLDFFTLFSSISGLIGQKGQANYAAGNAFLDALAYHRRSLGLPCCSIDLGAIDDVGYMSEHQSLLKALDTTAWTPINQSLLHQILRFSIEQQSKQPINAASSAQLVTSIAHGQRHGEALLSDARFGILSRGSERDRDWSTAGAAGDPVEEQVGVYLTLLRSGGNGPALRQAARSAVIARLGSMLQSTQPIEPERSLLDYGVDSLAGLELRNWVRSRLMAEISTLELTNSDSLAALGDEIATRASSSQKK